MNKKISVRMLVEIAIFAALAVALDMLEGGIFRGIFINGGSIGIAMVPVFIIAYRRGLLAGILTGLIVSLLQMLGGIYVISGATYEGAMKFLAPFFQVMLDYVLGFTLVGVAGAFAHNYHNATTSKNKILWIIVGTVVGGLLKYTSHVLAGGLFWLDPTGDPFLGVSNGSWWFSFVYNGAACIPSIILSTAVIILIYKIHPQFLEVSEKEDDAENAFSNDLVTESKEDKNEF